MQSSRPMSKEALIDILKFVFNLLLQYPRMTQTNTHDEDKPLKPGSKAKPSMGELWDEKLAPYVGSASDTSILRVSSFQTCPIPPSPF